MAEAYRKLTRLGTCLGVGIGKNRTLETVSVWSRVHLGGKAAILPLRRLDHFNRKMLCKVAAYDLESLVRRSIVHDHPFHRWEHLMNRRLDRPLDEYLFIASRANQNVAQIRAAFIYIIIIMLTHSMLESIL
jgi:hypothetical protein